MTATPTGAAMPAAAAESPDFDDLGAQLAVGRGLALALSALADRARAAEHDVRAASWEDSDAISGRLARAADPAVLPGLPTDDGGAAAFVPAGPHVQRSELDPVAAAATADAAAKVRVAFDAVVAAQQAVLAAQLASAEQQAAEGNRPRRRRLVPHGSLSTQLSVMWSAVRAEFRYLLARRPRKVLRALAIALLGAIAYMVYIRLFSWNTYGKWAPYLAVLFISSVMGTSACFNSMAFDAQRVRVALDTGARMWQILVVKNVALMALVLPLGVAMCLVLAFLTGHPATLVASIGLVLCILLLWSGVGNLLSVVLPIRDAPLKVHRQDGTIRQFLVEFAVTWAISYLVLGLLIWRVYSAKGVGEKYGSTWLAVGLLVLSAVIGWINMTVMAVAFSSVPTVQRRLRKELDWAPPAAPAATGAGDQPSPPAGSMESSPGGGSDGSP